MQEISKRKYVVDAVSRQSPLIFDHLDHPVGKYISKIKGAIKMYMLDIADTLLKSLVNYLLTL